jgi:hypothetical protein
MSKSDSSPHPLELLLREAYVQRAAGRSLARVFLREHRQIRQAAWGRNADFRFEDAVYFFGVAAATGVRKNLTYSALADLTRAIRKPKHEISGKGLKFESVISRKTYDRQRRQMYPRAMASRNVPGIEKKLEMEYKLMVTLSRKQQVEPPAIVKPLHAI